MNSKFTLAIALPLALSGCGAIGNNMGLTGTNTSVYSINQPVVERSNYALDVTVGASGVSASESARISEWFDALKLGFGDRLTVDMGDGYNSPAVRQDVNNIAIQFGLSLSDNAPLTSGQIVPGTARVIVTRSTASVPNCPNWNKSTEANYNSSVHPNFGCAVNSNLTAMVADKEDLVNGRDSTIKHDGGAGRPVLTPKN